MKARQLPWQPGLSLATGEPGCVYLQNSGLGNIVNPVVSMADTMVYSIPMLMMVGWRGEPGVTDEPQHAKQGLITTSLLDCVGIPFEILPDNDEEANRVVAQHDMSSQENECARGCSRQKKYICSL